MIKYSVIIISYDNFSSTTELILKSLLNSKSKYNTEIILFDNGSTDETIRGIKNYENLDDRLKTIFNGENLGFAGGNNRAFKHSTGNQVIFLNSDTITTFESLDILIDEMDDIKCQILGPISNAVSGVQKIKVYTNKVTEILKEGEFIMNSKHQLPPFVTDCLSFFCIAMYRSIFTKLNGLDEKYQLGYYEDTDFCFRARKKGIILFCTEKVFVYHKGEGSFANVSNTTTTLENKKRFKKLHGGFKSKKVRVENLDRIKSYRKQLKLGTVNPVIDFLFSRRTSMIYPCSPRNWVKKILYFLNYLAIILKD